MVKLGNRSNMFSAEPVFFGIGRVGLTVNAFVVNFKDFLLNSKCVK